MLLLLLFLKVEPLLNLDAVLRSLIVQLGCRALLGSPIKRGVGACFKILTMVLIVELVAIALE